MKNKKNGVLLLIVTIAIFGYTFLFLNKNETIYQIIETEKPPHIEKLHQLLIKHFPAEKYSSEDLHVFKERLQRVKSVTGELESKGLLRIREGEISYRMSLTVTYQRSFIYSKVEHDYVTVYFDLEERVIGYTTLIH